MKRRTRSVILGALLLVSYQPASAEDTLCQSLRRFVESVKLDETRVVKLHTIWGSNFKDSDEPAFYAKRCDHNSYPPAKQLCEFLMDHSAVEFSGNNAINVITCLSPKTRSAPRAELNAISISMVFGTKSGGGLVDVEYTEDTELGGMVLSITVDGY